MTDKAVFEEEFENAFKIIMNLMKNLRSSIFFVKLKNHVHIIYNVKNVGIFYHLPYVIICKFV